MHTIAKNQSHNTRLIKDFIQIAYPDGPPTLDQLIDDNIINGTQLMELAVSKHGQVDRCDVGLGRDFVDDSDVKTVTVQRVSSVKRRKTKSGIKSYNTVSFVAKIKDITAKVGMLRVVCWNPFSENYYYFRISPAGFVGQNHVAISFSSITQTPVGKYAQYQVTSFEEVCKPLNLKEQLETFLYRNQDSIQKQTQDILNLIKQNQDKL